MVSKKKALVEAALFISENPLDTKTLRRVAGITSDEELKKIIEDIKKEFDSTSHGIELALTPEGYQFQVKDQFLESIANLSSYSDISRGALRTLGIVALKQPILQSEIVKIQGNKAYNYIKSLEKKGLIKTEKSGRTRLVKTTKDFERYFGRSLKEIQEKLKTLSSNLKSS